MKFTIEHEQEADGRWLAAVPELSGVLACGATAEEAMAKAEVLAHRGELGIRGQTTIYLIMLPEAARRPNQARATLFKTISHRSKSAA